MSLSNAFSAARLQHSFPTRRSSDLGDQTNENATCYLQILLADQLPGMGRARMLADMDAWDYSFRLGSAQAWFEKDAEDARQTLVERGIVDARDDTVLICAPKSTSLNI